MDLRKIESNLYYIGLYPICEICTVPHNGKELKCSTFQIARNGNHVIMWRDRAPSGFWCIPVEIVIKNEKTGQVWRFVEDKK